MDISSLTNVSSDYVKQAQEQALTAAGSGAENDSFSSVFATAMNMVGEANDLQNTAEAEEMRFALGEAVNAHDLGIAQKKANVAIQYTVAVRDKVLEAYKEIMNMSM